ncbi:MAG: OmpA family protein [Bacteroidia bacterium]|nr:OmpA family protein [Bacteroidia bacterium]
MLRRIIVTICWLIPTLALLAQPDYKAEKKYLKAAEEFLKYDEYRMAIPHLVSAAKANPDNPETQYVLGKAYFLNGSKKKALGCFKKLYELNPNYPNPHLLMMYAMCLHFDLQIDAAIENYKKIKEKNLMEPYTMEDIKMAINQCENARILVKQPVNALIENVGPTVNSEYPDFAPVISADESMMLFTSRRKGNLGGPPPGNEFPYEDIYISYREDNGDWLPAINIGPPINTRGHDASIALSPDGQTLYIYKDDNGGDIFTCKLKGKTWGAPENIGKPINSRFYEPSVSISADGKLIFFVSNRDGGVGKRDIYYCKKLRNNKWSEPINLRKINTPYDDDAPFFHPNGKTLYFSSKGHNSMGGYDIFRTELQKDSTWSVPVNIGYPINTPDDDIYFVLSASGEHGYYASVKDGGLGEKDIYRITIRKPEVTSVVAKTEDINLKNDAKIEIPVPMLNNPVTLLKGIITDKKTKQPLEATIHVIDNELNDTISENISNIATGKYLVTLPSGKNYGIIVQAPDYLFYSENFNIPISQDYQEVVKNIELDKIITGSKVILKNIFFDFDKSTLRPESEAELDRLYKFLASNSSIRVKIGGHTDNKGSDEYNQKLSESRAKAVVDFLLSKGIDTKRLEYQGYGESKPIDTNDTEEGRQNNRRTEFEILAN